jgi:hypothetical protein
MRVIKLALISIVAFYLLIWAITLLFPNVTLVSRAMNIAGSKDSIITRIRSNEIPYDAWLTTGATGIDVRGSDISFYENDLFNAERQENADTVYIELRQNAKSFMRGGIAFYQLAPDSATVQLYYVFHTKWYMPWDKMAQIANDARYGDHLDSALNRLKKIVEEK